MTLTLKNALVNIVYYAGTMVALPAAALAVEDRYWGLPESPWPLRGLGSLLGVTGLVLQAWAIVLLQTRGGGTPSPAVPTVRLAIEGSYAWLRNPLNLGELLFFLGLAAWFASWILLLYAILAWFAFHVFIIAWEEPRHRRMFGVPYATYATRVSRWLPRPPVVKDSRAAAQQAAAADERRGHPG